MHPLHHRCTEYTSPASAAGRALQGTTPSRDYSTRPTTGGGTVQVLHGEPVDAACATLLIVLAARGGFGGADAEAVDDDRLPVQAEGGDDLGEQHVGLVALQRRSAEPSGCVGKHAPLLHQAEQAAAGVHGDETQPVPLGLALGELAHAGPLRGVAEVAVDDNDLVLAAGPGRPGRQPVEHHERVLARAGLNDQGVGRLDQLQRHGRQFVQGAGRDGGTALAACAATAGVRGIEGGELSVGRTGRGEGAAQLGLGGLPAAAAVGVRGPCRFQHLGGGPPLGATPGGGQLLLAAADVRERVHGGLACPGTGASGGGVRGVGLVGAPDGFQ